MKTKSYELDPLQTCITKQILDNYYQHLLRLSTSACQKVNLEYWKEAIVRLLLKKPRMELTQELQSSE